LLLQDLAPTHQPPVTRAQQIGPVEAVPPAAQIAECIETLGMLHAFWWQHLLLGEGHFDVGYWSRTRERFDAYLQRRTNSWQRVAAQEDASLPEDVRTLYEQALARLPSYWERYLEPRFRSSRHLTLAHGDAYFANFLCPIPPRTGTAYLLDWQSPEFDIGAYDLATLCATFWTREQRHTARREDRILHQYFDSLKTHGVRHYPWEDLLLDYRHALIFWLLMPVQDAADGSARDYWWPKMRCLLAAFSDWHCGALLGTEAGQ
jgi:hypothetical protein